tara:strand:+ start:9904 stop:10494 length:591 start_codon:yes stop_codon:yes gene_type:complete
MIGIIDYGAGNMGSLTNALKHLGIPFLRSNSPDKLVEVDKLILPGVGAFGPAMDRLNQLHLSSFLQKWAYNQKPLLGICLGMQLIFSESDENGNHRGLNIIPGKVKKIKNSLRSIHIGWNHVQLSGKSTTLSHSGFAYFVHAFACHPRDNNVVIGTTEYGEQFPSVIQMEKVFGVQFHPEKSQDFGLDILKRFSHV